MKASISGAIVANLFYMLGVSFLLNGLGITFRATTRWGKDLFGAALMATIRLLVPVVPNLI